MKRSAFTLIETLIAVTIMAILATIAVTASGSAGTQTLESVARVMATDLRLARSLAIQYNTEYAVEFDVQNNRYQIVHTGTGTPPPLEDPLTPDGQAGPIELGRLGTNGMDTNGIQLAAAVLKDAMTSVSDVTFGPLGGTGPARNEDTLVVLSQGTGADLQTVKLTVSWVTGQVWIE